MESWLDIQINLHATVLMEGGLFIFWIPANSSISNFPNFGLKIHLKENLCSTLLLDKVNILWIP